MNTDEPSEQLLWEQSASASGLDRGDALLALGERLFGREAFEESAAATATAAEVYLEHDRPGPAATALFGQGLALLALGRHDEALQALTDAAGHAQAAGDGEQLGRALHRAGDALLGLDRPGEALERLDEAQQAFIAAGNTYGAAVVALDRGELLGASGRHADALEVLNGARGGFRSAGDARRVAQADDRVAAALIELGHLDRALDRLRAALHVWELDGDRARLAHARFRLGWTLVIAEQPRAALDQLRVARGDYLAEGDLFGAARSDEQIAAALEQLGEHDDAIDLYRRVRDVFDAHGRDDSVLVVDANLGEAYARAGRSDEAEHQHRRVLERAQQLGDRYVAAAVTTRLATLLSDRDRPGEALELLDAVRGTFEGQDHRLESANLDLERARALVALGRWAEARVLAQRVATALARTSLRSALARAHALLSDAALQQGDQAGSLRLRATAMALHLAAGEPTAARQLAAAFLDDLDENWAPQMPGGHDHDDPEMARHTTPVIEPQSNYEFDAHSGA